MHEFATRIEKHFRFSSRELSALFITSLVATFVLTFGKFAGYYLDIFTNYITNFFVIGLFVIISFFIHFSSQKLMALAMGYSSKYKYWLNGLLISIIVSLFTYGYIPLFFTGSLWHEPIEKLRTGVFRGGAKHKDIGYIAFAGPLSNILLVGLLTPIYIATENYLIRAIIIINLLTAVFSLLPLPTFEKIRQFRGGTTGLYLFIASRWVYVLVFVTFLVFALLILFFQLFSYILALLIGIIMTIIYYLKFEKEE